MYRFRALAVALAGIALMTGPSHAAAPKAGSVSPLQMVPSGADIVLQLHDPARAIRAVTRLDLLAQFAKLVPVKEQLDSTSVRRLRQLVAYFEKALGMKWPALLERLAGGGAAVGLKYGNDNPPIVLVVRGTDEKLLEKFIATAIEVLEGELARQESKDKIQKGEYHGVPVYRLGPLFAARAGATLVLSNKKDALGKSLALHLGREKESALDHPGLRESIALLPKSLLASGWLNMAPIQQSPAGKTLYATPRDNPQLTVLFGGYLDLLGRTPYLCAGLAEAPNGFLLTIRAPRGTVGMGVDRLLHVAADGQPGSRPLLEPKGALYSASYYMDVASIWKDRDRLFNKVQAGGLTNLDKNSARTLGGVKLSTLLESAGPYQRLVVVNQAKRGYQREPKLRLPAFAIVQEMRQPERFGRAMETLLRAAALFATGTFKMELKEEKYREHDLIAYRFDEKADLKDDINDVRYNFSPSFVRVGKQFVICSTVELCRELVNLLIAEAHAKDVTCTLRAKDRYYSKGVADLLRDLDDQLITQTILDQAVPPSEARKQVEAAIRVVRGLGSVTGEVLFGPDRFRYDLRITLGK